MINPEIKILYPDFLKILYPTGYKIFIFFKKSIKIVKYEKWIFVINKSLIIKFI